MGQTEKVAQVKVYEFLCCMDEQYSLDADSLMFHQPFVSIRVNKTAKCGCVTVAFRFGS